MPASTTAAAANRRGAAASPQAVHDGFDVLRLRGVRALIVWPGFPYVFLTTMLAVFVGLAMIAWGVHAPVGVNAKLFAKTNLATLMILGRVVAGDGLDRGAAGARLVYGVPA